jgi:hypothetical protein
MKKTRSKKSRDTVPLIVIISAISHALQLSSLCFQSMLSPFTPVYPMLSVSAIPLYYSTVFPCFLSLPSPMRSNCLACAFSPLYKSLPSAISLCYSPLQLFTLCYQTFPIPLYNCLPRATSLCYPFYNCLHPVPPISAILLYNCLPCATSLCYPPNCLYPTLLVSAIPLNTGLTLCCQSVLFPSTPA